MSYKKCYAERLNYNTYKIHLWEDKGYQLLEWKNQVYKECDEYDSTHTGLNGEPLKKVMKWNREDPKLHFHDVTAYQKFLIEKYGIDDTPSTTHKECFFDIEIEMGDALTPEYIRSAPKKVTSIAWYDLQIDMWYVIILDTKNQLKHYHAKNKEIIPVESEKELLAKFLERLRTGEFWNTDQPIEIAGVQSLDYMRMHRKYSWEDEPSWKLDALGAKYANLNKIEYEGSLDKLFEEDIFKFIQYNFRDVEILVKWDEKSQYLALTKNLAHKGKINYSDVYASSKIHDGAISAYVS